MIVPRTRLLLLAALMLTPAALLSAFAPDALPLLFCLILFLALVAVIDLTGAVGLVHKLSVDFHDHREAIGNGDGAVFRFTKDRAGDLQFKLQNAAGRPLGVRLGVALPLSIPATEPTVQAQVPSDGKEHVLRYECTPSRRGAFSLEAIYLEVQTRWGLWDLRRKAAAKAELRVYPNLLQERNRLAAIFLNRGGLGIHAQRQVGKGREFEQLREYIAGDSYEDIHWKATARRSRPITKMFQLERTQEVYVLLDTSRLSARTTQWTENGESFTQLDRFIQSAMMLGMVAEKQGDLFGLLTFSDRVHHFVRAGAARTHFQACRDALYTAEPRMVTPDFEALSSFVRLRLRRRALLMVLTNLDDPVQAESFVRNMELLTKRHLVLVNMITPEGVAPLFSEPAGSIDDVYRHLAGHLQWRELRELQRTLQHKGATLSMLQEAQLTPELVSQYMNVKKRQLL